MSEGRITIKAVGDIGLNAGIGALIAARGPSHLFGGVAEALAGADLLFGNLEMPLAPAPAPPAWPEVRESFRADPVHASALPAGGFGLLSLANNHVMDFGVEGLRTTRRTLERLGIPYAGAGETLEEARRPALVEVRGLRVGLLACARAGRHSAGEGRPGAAPLDADQIAEDLARLAPRADLRIVSLHFGMVYSDYPAPADRELAHRIVEAGADLILGHHPHVVQGVERVGRALVAYSLGEFLFDPSCGHVVSRVAADVRRQTVVLSATLGLAGAGDVELIPVRIDDDLRPMALTGQQREQAARRLETLCEGASSGDARLFSEQMASRTVQHQRDVFMHHLRRGHVGILLPWLLRARPRHLGMLLRALWKKVF